MVLTVNNIDRQAQVVLTTEQLVEHSNLSKSQLMIWMGQQLETESPLYNMVLCFYLQEIIDTECFQQAFSTLISSSDALRTIIETVNGIPQQRVLDQLDYQIEIVDLSNESVPEQALADWIAIHNKQQFNLSQCSFESTLLYTGNGQTVWYFNQHHLTTDAWSISLIYKN